MEDWVIGRVIEKKTWTSNLFSLIIKAPVHFFIAGQFTKLRLEVSGKRIQRAYSYVNAPNNPNLEFYLAKIPNGKLSSKLAELNLGDKIQVMSKASGFFTIDNVPDCKNLWMLATGTAIGPYLSILEYGKGLERFKNIILVHAVRYTTDLNYLVNMITLQNRYKNKLHIQTIVSREKTNSSLNGHIQDLIKNELLEKTVGLTIDTQTSHVMLCGNPNMIRDTQQLLKESRQMNKHLRIKPGHITTEQYW